MSRTVPESLFTVPYPLGQVVVTLASDGKVRGIAFDRGGRIKPSPSSSPFARSLASYLAGKERDLQAPPANLTGYPPFFLRVWAAASRIPYGRTVSYRRVAEMAGNPRAARAAGRALAANPVPLLVPCHRVVGSDGSLRGFSSGLDVKRWLLELEGALT